MDPFGFFTVFMFCSAKFKKLVVKRHDCHLKINLFANGGSLRCIFTRHVKKELAVSVVMNNEIVCFVFALTCIIC